MKKIVNNANREIGLLCSPAAIILGVAEAKDITDEQIEELKRNSVSFQAWRERVFFFLDEKGKRIRAPRAKKNPFLINSPAAVIGPNYYRRGDDGVAIKITRSEWKKLRESKELRRREIENYFFWTVEKSLPGTATAVEYIRVMANRRERSWLKKAYLDDEATLEILLKLQEISKARTGDHGLTWRRAAKKRTSPNRR